MRARTSGFEFFSCHSLCLRGLRQATTSLALRVLRGKWKMLGEEGPGQPLWPRTTQAGSPHTQIAPRCRKGTSGPLPHPPAMSPLPPPAPARDILCPGDVTRPWEPWLEVADSTRVGFIFKLSGLGQLPAPSPSHPTSLCLPCFPPPS